MFHLFIINKEIKRMLYLSLYKKNQRAMNKTSMLFHVIDMEPTDQLLVNEICSLALYLALLESAPPSLLSP